MESEASDDRLSGLPLSIIDDILCRVPTADAIKTSLLSRQFRYTWTTLPNLLFDGNDESEMDIGKKFISNVLLHHRGPIHRFKMYLPFCVDFDCVDEWMLTLSKNDIRELILIMNDDSDSSLLKSSIYLCVELRELEVWNFSMDPPPSTFKGFLFLTDLVLIEVELSSDSVETLVSSCPLLERLTILQYSSLELRIRLLNLKRLRLYGDYRELSLNAPLLDVMDVALTVGQFSGGFKSSVCNYSNFFKGCNNLVTLIGKGYFTQYLSIGLSIGLGAYPPIEFNHIEVIHLDGVKFDRVEEVVVVFFLTICAPNMRKLKIRTVPRYGEEAPNASLWNVFQLVISFNRLVKLRVVRLEFVCEYPLGMELVKFLLESSPLLETMELLFSDHTRHCNASTELLGFRLFMHKVSVRVQHTTRTGLDVS